MKVSRRRFLIGVVATTGLIGASALAAAAWPVVVTRAGWQKDPRNPVLGGPLGSVFDVSVRREGATYQMWFSWRPRGSIAYCESADGVRWGEPQIALGPDPTSGWEDAVNRPVVMRQADRYHMWYTGQTAVRSAIGYATSLDGSVWLRASGHPVLSADASWEQEAVMCPHVLWDDATGVLRMWYSGGAQYEPDAIGHAISRDGLTWVKDPANPVFTPGSAGDWDGSKVTACHVEPVSDGYLMFYAGFRDVDHAQIGLARSADGLGGWHRHPDNPIIGPGAWPTWDRDAVYKPSVVHDPGRWLIWYNGRGGSTEQIGRAVHEGNDLSF